MLRADAHDAVVATMHNLDYFEMRLRDAGVPLEELRWGSDTWTRGGHVAALERQQWREVRATWTAAIRSLWDWPTKFALMLSVSVGVVLMLNRR